MEINSCLKLTNIKIKIISHGRGGGSTSPAAVTDPSSNADSAKRAAAPTRRPCSYDRRAARRRRPPPPRASDRARHARPKNVGPPNRLRSSVRTVRPGGLATDRPRGHGGRDGGRAARPRVRGPGPTVPCAPSRRPVRRRRSVARSPPRRPVVYIRPVARASVGEGAPRWPPSTPSRTADLSRRRRDGREFRGRATRLVGECVWWSRRVSRASRPSSVPRQNVRTHPPPAHTPRRRASAANSNSSSDNKSFSPPVVDEQKRVRTTRKMLRDWNSSSRSVERNALHGRLTAIPSRPSKQQYFFLPRVEQTYGNSTEYLKKLNFIIFTNNILMSSPTT